MQTVRVDAARSNRSLTSGQPDRAASIRQRRINLANPVLLMFRRQIDTAVADAKKTRHGMPSALAISQRWWIQENRPDKNDRTKLGRMLYAGSFECCCEMLGLNADQERDRVLAEIDDAIVAAVMQHVGDAVYQHKAAVLRCAGIPSAIGTGDGKTAQYILGLVDPEDYEDVADPDDAAALAAALRRERRASSRRARRLPVTAAAGAVGAGL